MKIYRLNEDGFSFLVQVVANETEVDIARGNLPSGRYFYHDEYGTRWFFDSFKEKNNGDIQEGPIW